MVEFKDVSVTYSSGVDALNKINLKINDGDFAFVVGSNGAGKSTLIKLILKEIDATEGTVIANGYNLKKIRRSKISKLRRTIGVVFQDFRLIPTMTVYENLRLGAYTRKDDGIVRSMKEVQELFPVHTEHP